MRHEKGHDNYLTIQFNDESQKVSCLYYVKATDATLSLYKTGYAGAGIIAKHSKSGDVKITVKNF